MRILSFTLFLFGWAAGFTAWPAALVDFGAEWRYFIGASEASSPDLSAWRRGAFSDTAWFVGTAPVGYANPPGDPAEQTLVTTIPSSQEANYNCVFFRKAFSVSDPGAVRQLLLTIQVDDGYVAWINGVEVGRYNVPDGELTRDAQADGAIEPTLSSTTITNGLRNMLAPGANILAVQVFNANLGSSDLFLDASLTAEGGGGAPVVADTTPAPGATVAELSVIAVTFDRSVAGVEASDLLVNGIPAERLTQVSPREYVFTFPQPAEGPVTAAWAAGHGIQDLASPPAAFGGGSWSYTLDPTPLPASVVISEFMADNQHGIKDDQGSRSDWIELRNAGLEAVNLDGWFLTDTTNDLTKWRFPAVFLDVNRYLLVWASGTSRTNPAAPLHANFKLGREGGFLALVDAGTNIVSRFAPGYPPQRADVSYGRDVVDPSITGFFATPTPGTANTTSGSGFAPEPAFSEAEGVFTNSTVVVSLSTTAGEIRYTLDGSAPTTNSSLYTSPLTLTTTTTVKARVFQPGLFPSSLAARTFFLLDATAARFTSNLPLLLISTSGRGIVDHPAPGTPRTFASVVVQDTFRGRSSPLGRPEYFGQGGISIRAQSSSGFPKRPYRLELQDAYGNDRKTGLLAMPEGSDWVLYNCYTDKPFLQNFLAMELFEKMGRYAVRRKFVEVYVNTAGGRVSYPRDYAGVYLLMEKIKVAKDRVDIAELTPYDTTEPNISGGYIFKKDKDTAGDRNFSTTGGSGFPGQTLKIHDPLPRLITSQQLAWLTAYLRKMESALYAPDWRTRTGTNHYSHYLDVDSFVDQHWIVEYAKQIDGYRLSNYMHKDRNGKVKMEPIWDWNLSFGNADYLDGYNTSGWYWSLLGANDHIWLRRLMCGTSSAGGTTGDPDFNQRIADRWSVLRTNVLAASNVLARVDEMAAYLNEGATRDFQKWPRLGTYVWPNPGIYVTPRTYAGIITSFKNWIQGRYNWIDNQFTRPPALNLDSARIPEGFNLTMSAPAGTIYYTLDGSDPRLPGGGISPKAQVYSGGLRLSGNARTVARALSGSRWSGPATASYYVSIPFLAVTEILYHPAPPPAASPHTAGDYEFVEFKNTGSTELNLLGFRLTGEIEFAFPDYLLRPGERVLLVGNRAAFEARYGTGRPIAGEYLGGLNDGGGRLVVTGPLGEPVLDFAFNDAWHPVTDGLGFSLVLRDENTSRDRFSQAGSWRVSAAPGGSPGLEDPTAPIFPEVVVNEVLSHPALNEPDLIELRNLEAVPANVGGWFISDDARTPFKYRIPESTIIPPGGFVTFSSAAFSDPLNPNVLVPFGLSSLGDEVYLFSGGAGANLTGYRHGFRYGAQSLGVSFGRHSDSLGREHFTAQATPTFGLVNSGPRPGSVIINEILYHPPEVLANGGWWNNTEDEFVELRNAGDTAVPLYDPRFPTNTWRIKGDVGFRFAPNVSLPPKSFMLVVNFDPTRDPSQLAAFRSKYAVPASVPIVGPYSGNLDNSGGGVSLYRPDAPIVTGPDTGTVPEVLVDEVEYDQDSPWPPAADGLGFALSRVSDSAFGNDPASWRAAYPTPGAPAAPPGEAIAILRQPAGRTALSGQTVGLQVVATASSPLHYQWRHNGENVSGATNATLELPGVAAVQNGAYQVVIWSRTAVTNSETALLKVEPDTDQDGLPDAWEFDRLMNPYETADAQLDFDADGASNLEEYIAGTDPRDARSRLRIESLSVSAKSVLAFTAAADRSYTIQYTPGIDPAAWARLADVPARPTNHAAVVSDSSISTNRYYRLITPALP
jgi:hypothetical protein